MTYITKFIQTTSFVIAFTTISLTAKAQNLDINSIWNASGSIATQAQSLGISALQMQFMANDVFIFSYTTSGGGTESTSGTWAQLTPNSFKFRFNPGDPGIFAQLCPDDTITVGYSIASDIMTMNSVVAPNCNTMSSFLNQSTWQNATAGIEDKAAANFRLFPNPASGTLSVQFNSTDATSPIEIASVNGTLVNYTVQNQTNGTLKVDISNLPAGTYLLKSKNHSQLFVVE